MACLRRRLTALAALALLLLPGCYGLSHNPAYFPWNFKPFGDIVRTHGKPTGLGYYANFDPHAVRVEVRPLEGVSPVRKHYVLIATVYDEDNQPRRNRRVEWMLEGAGNIIEVDESGFFPGRGYKVDNHYAVSYTNYAEHRVTRGNSDPADDFVLRPGQTWCIISSAVEGDSHVTVHCPEIYNWESNKVVVTTRWVDVEWAFPHPSAARAGTPHVLTTSVIRSTDKQPLAGYRVRYRLLDGGAPAAFVPGGAEAVAVSDLRGQASVTLQQLQPGAGVSRIGIEIIRAPDPSKPSDAGLVLVRGETTVDWQAPVVSLDLTAPPTVVVGGELPYTVTLSNSGAIESRALTVRLAIPEGLEPLRSDPPATPEGRELVWTLGDVPARQSRSLQSVFRATRLGVVSNRVTVTTSEGLRGEKTLATEVTPQPQPALKVTAVGPATAALDGTATWQITVSNPGTGPAANVLLHAGFDAGLAHESSVNPIETRVGPLEAGGSRNVTLMLAAKAVGPQRLRLRAKADGNVLSEVVDQTVTVQRAALSLENRGPAWCYAGRPATWTIKVRNSGEVPLAGVVVRYALPPELAFRSATENGLLQGSEVVWNVGSLPAGAERNVAVTAVCQSLTEKTTARATAVAESGVRAEAPADVQVRGVAALRMRVVDTEDPVVAGGRTEYRIEVVNSGTLPSPAVRIVADVPREMRPLTPTGPTTGKVEGQRVTFEPLTSLAPGQRVTFSVPVEATRAGFVYFRAELSSETLSKEVVEEESTNIIPEPKAG